MTGFGMARYMELTMREVGEAQPGTASLEGFAPASTHLRTRDGGIAMGALLTLADTVGGLCAGLAALPGWVVTTNLMLRSIRLDVVGPLGLAATVRRAGSKAVVATVTIRDIGGHDALVADASLTSAVLQPENGPPHYDRPLVLAPLPLDAGDRPPLSKFLGIRTTAVNQLTIDITETLQNPWGILHGGATAALVDLAGVHATAETHPDSLAGWVTTDAVLHFVSPGRVGPVTATVVEQGERADGSLLRVEVRDAGAADRLMALAVTTVRPTSPNGYLQVRGPEF